MMKGDEQMDYTAYERHQGLDPELPIIFQHTALEKESGRLYREGIHWHENIEIIHVLHGKGSVLCGLNSVEASAGETVVINGNEIHAVEGWSAGFSYDYLIPDASIPEAFGLEIYDIAFQNQLGQDECMQGLFRQLQAEMSEKRPAYRCAVKAIILQIYLHLIRQWQSAGDERREMAGDRQKIQLIRQSLDYMQTHYSEHIALESLCEQVGLSKYYFCRTFRMVTGMTAVEYLNRFRCQKAQKFLQSGRYTIAEAAEQVGFGVLPYFYRVYKRYMDRLPSADLPGMYAK